MITIRTFDMNAILGNELLLSSARRLTLGYPSSGMNRALDQYSHKFRVGEIIDAKGIFAYNGEWACGWCLLTKEADGMDFCPAEGYSCVQIFVDERYRRKGIGSALLKEAAAQSTGQIIQCYSWENPEFFQPFINNSNFKEI